jgi:hypothetical protein
VSAAEQDEWPDPGAFVPGHPEVYVRKVWGEGDTAAFEHCGWPDHLIAAGVATETMLQARGNGVAAKAARLDGDGDRCYISSWHRSREGTLARYFKIRRTKKVTRIDRLPGAREAMQAARAWHKWYAQREELYRRKRLEAEREFRRQFALDTDGDDMIPEAVQHQVDELLQRFMRP